MHNFTCQYNEEKIQTIQEALKNFFTLQTLEYVEDTITGETGWSWIVIVGDKKKKNGKIKNHLTTVTISKLSDTLCQMSYGKDINILDVITKIGASAGWYLLSPLVPLLTIGILGGVIAAAVLKDKRRQVEKGIKDILTMHLNINEKEK